MPDYDILVCPICRKQVEDSWEEGYCLKHQYATAQRVTVHLDPEAESQLALAAYRSQEAKRDEDWRIAGQRYLNGLTDEERREKLSPSAYAMDSMIRESYREMAEDFKRSENFWKGIRADH